MSVKFLTYHLAEEANPAVILSIIDGWMVTPDRVFATAKALLENIGEFRDIPKRTEPINIGIRLGLIRKMPEGLTLAPLARRLSSQRNAIRIDMMHFLAYTAWNRHNDEDLTPFWSYRSTCDAMWQAAPVSLENERVRLVEHVISASQIEFSNHPSYDVQRVSYSAKSVRAIVKWLELLAPPVVYNGLFQQRTACSSELAILALAEAYRSANAEPGVELLLTNRIRDVVCRICLLDPAYLDRILDWALARHAALVERADQSGTFGRSVRLKILPSVENVITLR